MSDRVAKLEAQMNAMAQIALRLAAILEMQKLVEPDRLDRELRGIRWDGMERPDNLEARKTVHWFADQLADARANRSGAQAG